MAGNYANGGSVNRHNTKRPGAVNRDAGSKKIKGGNASGAVTTPGNIDEDDDECGFEAELAMLGDQDNENDGQDIQQTNGEGPDTENTCSRWSRPALPQIDVNKDRVIFQQLDVDYYIDKPLSGMPVSKLNKSGHVPIVRMFGVTDGGNSVLCHVHGFLPYFFTPAPPDFTEDDIEPFHKRLNEVVLSDMRSNREELTYPVLAVELCIKESIYGYHGNKKLPFLKITMALPRLVAAGKRILETGFTFSPRHPTRGYQSYESNIDFEIRFMVDADVVGCNWIELPARSFKIRSATNAMVSRCQLEVDVPWTALISHPPEDEWQRIAPIRILSFDIECAGRREVYPHYTNVAPGLARSFYDGYLKILSRGHWSHIMRELGSVVSMPGIVLLFPVHTRMQHRLDSVPGCSVVGTVTVVRANRGGQAQRIYAVSIYEIHLDGKYYYAALEGALGIDHIDNIFENNCCSMSQETKDIYKEEQYSQYINILRKYANGDERMCVSGGDGDIFMFLVYNDRDPSTSMARLIIKGIQEYATRKDMPLTRYDAKINVSLRLQKLHHTPILSDKTVEEITEKRDNKYSVKLRGPFLADESDTLTGLTYDQVKLAAHALDAFEGKAGQVESEGDAAECSSSVPDATMGFQPRGSVTLASDNHPSFCSFPHRLQSLVLTKVSSEISRDWRRLYRELSAAHSRDPSQVEVEIEGFEAAEAGGDLAELAHNALNAWLQREGAEATLNTLRRALVRCGRKAISDDIDEQCKQFRDEDLAAVAHIE